VTNERAHSGRYSIKLTGVADSLTGDPNSPRGAGVFRAQPFPEEAYYSAWYFLPIPYEPSTSWTILSFKSMDDPGEPTSLIDLRLRSLPDGGLTLSLFDHRAQYLESPLPALPPEVPIGSWFQIETLYRNVADSTGRIAIWLNGIAVYDERRPMTGIPWVYFSPCNTVNAMVPSSAVLYIDDVAVSTTPVTTSGVLTAFP
jgi:hypothetical protein